MGEGMKSHQKSYLKVCSIWQSLVKFLVASRSWKTKISIGTSKICFKSTCTPGHSLLHYLILSAGHSLFHYYNIIKFQFYFQFWTVPVFFIWIIIIHSKFAFCTEISKYGDIVFFGNASSLFNHVQVAILVINLSLWNTVNAFQTNKLPIIGAVLSWKRLLH